MKAAILRIPIFIGTSRTQLKLAQRRVAAVVRQIPDDGVTRPALRAIDEGVPIPPCLRIIQFIEALSAGS